MKAGIRKASIKKSISARTTGRAKRKLKRMANPFYGKKGMGWVRNPQKALYNKIYRKTTVSSKKAISAAAWLISIPFAAAFYTIAFCCLLLWWLVAAVVNGIISLAEYVINLNSDETDILEACEEQAHEPKPPAKPEA